MARRGNTGPSAQGARRPARETSIAADTREPEVGDGTLRRQNAYLAAMHEMAIALMHRRDMADLLQTMVDRAVALLGTEHGYIYLVEDGDKELTVRAGCGMFQAYMGFRLSRGEGMAGRVWASGEPLVVDDYDSWAGRSGRLPRVGVRSVVGAPLTLAGSVAGVIGVARLDGSQPFGGEAAAALSQFAELASVALDNARLYELSQTQVAELQHLYRQMRDLEQLKTQMIRVAGHDLRSPMGIISAYLSLIEEDLGDDGPRFQQFLGPMRRAIERMQRLTTDLLSLDRIHEGQDKTWQVFGLRETIQRAVADSRDQAQASGLRIETELDEREATILGDPVQIHQAVGNLISNAIKYTPEGGRITVRYRCGSGRSDFEVEDTGIGVREEHKDKLFEPFYRAQTDETRLIEGTGLGLYLVKTIVEQHAGTMIFDSTHGQGSVFGFSLPHADALARDILAE